MRFYSRANDEPPPSLPPPPPPLPPPPGGSEAASTPSDCIGCGAQFKSVKARAAHTRWCPGHVQHAWLVPQPQRSSPAVTGDTAMIPAADLQTAENKAFGAGQRDPDSMSECCDESLSDVSEGDDDLLDNLGDLGDLWGLGAL